MYKIRKGVALIMTFFIMLSLLSGCGSNSKSTESIDSKDNTEIIEQETPSETPGSAENGSDTNDNRIEKMQSATLQYPAQNEEWKYNVYDCYIEITDYIGQEVSNLTIPDEIEDLPVWVINPHSSDHSIGEDWQNPLTNVILPDTLLVVADDAFRYLAIETVNFPVGLTTIGEGGFYHCPIKSIELPDTVTEIGDFAFACAEITEIELPSSVVRIGENAFNGCSLLEKAVIPESTKEIGDGTFSSCNWTSEAVKDDQGNTLEYERVFHDFDIYIYSLDVLINGDIGSGKIHGYAGSTVAKYCADNNREFEILQ